jgi:uncharacterized surface protein with fasciclin (FAS1) repeats
MRSEIHKPGAARIGEATMRPLKTVCALAVLLLAAMIISACGSSGGSATSASPSAAASPSPSSVPVTTVTPIPTVTSTSQITDLLKSGQFSDLAKALAGTGLTKALAGAGPWTLFAPDQQAFTPAVAASLLKAAKNGQVEAILKYHVVKGQIIDLSTVTSGETFTTLEGSPVTLDSSNGAWTVDGVPIVKGIMAKNGAVYEISGLLVPPSPSAASASPSP